MTEFNPSEEQFLLGVFKVLPDEKIVEIISKMTSFSIQKFCSASSEFSRICKDYKNIIWSDYIRNRYPNERIVGDPFVHANLLDKKIGITYFILLNQETAADSVVAEVVGTDYDSTENLFGMLIENINQEIFSSLAFKCSIAGNIAPAGTEIYLITRRVVEDEINNVYHIYPENIEKFLYKKLQILVARKNIVRIEFLRASNDVENIVLNTPTSEMDSEVAVNLLLKIVLDRLGAYNVGKFFDNTGRKTSFKLFKVTLPTIKLSHNFYYDEEREKYIAWPEPRKTLNDFLPLVELPFDQNYGFMVVDDDQILLSTISKTRDGILQEFLTSGYQDTDITFIELYARWELFGDIVPDDEEINETERTRLNEIILRMKNNMINNNRIQLLGQDTVVKIVKVDLLKRKPIQPTRRRLFF